MAKIHVLSKETIDKIAAGEVVERPSSVVKELMENAVDAGAAAITVEIKEGGISFIRVTDNGSGIDKEQVPKAFLRHATSKIRDAEDLFRIASLGFRGEALSSIAAVSRMELVTKTRDDLTGLRYVIEGGEEKENEEIGAPDGTTIIVRNLFFNTPVRRKFLKQPQTEGGYISDLMEHMAMSHPRISFKYINNNQTRFHTSGNGDLKEIIYRIYGKDISSALLPIDVEENGIHMSGFLGKPEVNRANRNFEIYFVNGRFIKSGIIGKAIEEGYRKYVMQHKFPFAVLHFQIDSGDIDVNVHPTKMEVRFTNQSLLYDFIAKHITDVLHSTELIPEVKLTERSGEQPSPAKMKTSAGAFPEPFEKERARKEGVGQGMPEPKRMPERPVVLSERPAVMQEKNMIMPEHSTLVQEKPVAKLPAVKGVAQESLYKVEEEVSVSEDDDFFVDNRKEEEAVTEQEAVTATETPVQLNLFEEKMLTRDARKEYQIMGQIFNTYWLVAFHDKLFIIDQHAAHEKVKYENLMTQLENNEVPSQMLNPPVIVTLSGREESVLKECMDSFLKMGFEIEAFGGNEYTIRSIPMELYGCSANELFTEMLDELAQGPVKGTASAIRQRIATMACKAAVKGNMSFDRAGIEALIDQLLTLEDPYHCPHGRPTIISMSKYEIEKKFKRIV